MIKSFYILFLACAIILLSPFRYVLTSEKQDNSRCAQDHIIVKFKKENVIQAAGNINTNRYESKVKDIAEELQLYVTRVKILFPRSINQVSLYNKYELETYQVVFFNNNKDRDVRKLCKEFEKNPKVEFAEPDFIGEGAGKKGTGEFSMLPNDTYFGRQWGLNNDGSTAPTVGRNGKTGADMNVIKGWEIQTGNEEVIVAVLDSGVKLDHPDLNGRIWINKNESRNGRDDDGNSYVDDTFGWNFAYENNNVKDDGGHGTNICGTIGASTNNNLGYAGIDQKCKIMICKNLDDENTGEYSWWAASLYYAANNGAKIINMSEGGYDYSKTLTNAINFAYDAGCLICASMMNKNNDDNYYPACLPNVMAIGATDTDDNRCRQFTWGGGSNWGKHISVIAPGNRIYGLDYKNNDDYDVYWSGTSQATAYVTGIAALLLAQDNTRTNKQLKDIITSTAKDEVGDSREDTPGWDKYYGYGRVDLYAALTNDKSKTDDNYKDRNNDDNNGNLREKKNSGDDNGAKAVDRNSDNGNKKDNDDGPAKKVDH